MASLSPDIKYSPCHVDEEDAMGENDAHPGVIGVTYDDLSAPTWEELVHCQEVLTNQEDWKGREGLRRIDDEDKFGKKKFNSLLTCWQILIKNIRKQ